MFRLCLVLAIVLAAVGLPVNALAQATIDVPADTMIRLQRTACFGECPIYTVTIDALGNVTYNGERFVRVIGQETAHIEMAAIARLLATAKRLGFFELKDSYRSIQNPNGTITVVTDLPTRIVTISMDGRIKRVENYFGGPEALADFEREIDEVAGSARWIGRDVNRAEKR